MLQPHLVKKLVKETSQVLTTATLQTAFAAAIPKLPWIGACAECRHPAPALHRVSSALLQVLVAWLLPARLQNTRPIGKSSWRHTLFLFLTGLSVCDIYMEKSHCVLPKRKAASITYPNNHYLDEQTLMYPSLLSVRDRRIVLPECCGCCFLFVFKVCARRHKRPQSSGL